MLEFDNGSRGLAGHVVNGILVAEPVGALDGIVHVPPPVILVHVPEGSVDATLGGNGMTSRGEELRDTGSVEAGLGKTECCTETRATCADNESIVLMILWKDCG